MLLLREESLVAYTARSAANPLSRFQEEFVTQVILISHTVRTRSDRVLITSCYNRVFCGSDEGKSTAELALRLAVVAARLAYPQVRGCLSSRIAEIAISLCLRDEYRG